MAFTIRKARLDDAEFVIALFALPHVKEFAHGPTSKQGYCDFVLRIEADGSDRLHIVERDGRPFGHANYDFVDGWLFDIRTIAFEEQRTGAGLYTMQWLLDRSFRELHAHRAFLEVLDRNASAKALYERVGFLREGCYRDGFRAADGTFHDLIPYGMLASGV